MYIRACFLRKMLIERESDLIHSFAYGYRFMGCRMLSSPAIRFFQPSNTLHRWITTPHCGQTTLCSSEFFSLSLIRSLQLAQHSFFVFSFFMGYLLSGNRLTVSEKSDKNAEKPELH